MTMSRQTKRTRRRAYYTKLAVARWHRQKKIRYLLAKCCEEKI